MNLHRLDIPLKQTHAFSALVQDFVQKDEFLRPFLTDFPTPEAVQELARSRAADYRDRAVLQEVLNEAYARLRPEPAVQENLAKLGHPNTVTVCTAHQPGVFTGHLYFVYKTLHCIRVCREMNALNDGLHYVPVFYLGSEDNDLEEIGELPVDGGSLQWDSGQTGACGRMKTSGFEPLLSAVESLLQPDRKEDRQLMDLFRRAYNGEHTLAEATRFLLHELFGTYGLLVLDADDARLKRLFLPVLREELFHQSARPVVEETLKRLGERYREQATPRDLNLFYLQPGIRERIEKQGEAWVVMNTAIRFNQVELQEELEAHPERFSPNVILRPLYQERILPNALFIGGGSEVAYWMQLHDLFRHHGVSFPILQLRRSLLWVPDATRLRIERTGLTWPELFEGEDPYRERLIRQHESLYRLAELQGRVGLVLGEISTLADALSPTLHRSTEAHHTGMRKAMQRVEKKFLAHLRRQENEQLERYRRIRQHLFPGGTLQERKEGLIFLYRETGPGFPEALLAQMSAFGQEFIVLWKDEKEFIHPEVERK